MKAEIKKGTFWKGNSNEYYLSLIPENEKEQKLLKKLFSEDVVWVAPTRTDRQESLQRVSWWGKK